MKNDRKLLHCHQQHSSRGCHSNMEVPSTLKDIQIKRKEHIDFINIIKMSSLDVSVCVQASDIIKKSIQLEMEAVDLTKRLAGSMKVTRDVSGKAAQLSLRKTMIVLRKQEQDSNHLSFANVLCTWAEGVWGDDSKRAGGRAGGLGSALGPEEELERAQNAEKRAIAEFEYAKDVAETARVIEAEKYAKLQSDMETIKKGANAEIETARELLKTLGEEAQKLQVCMCVCACAVAEIISHIYI